MANNIQPKLTECSGYQFGILNIIWRETKARLSTHASQKSKMAGLLVGVACMLSLAFVFAPNNIKNSELVL